MGNKSATKEIIPKFQTLVHNFAKHGFQLSRRDNLVFFKLLGFLLKDDKPLIYPNEKLAQETLYKISSIKESLNNLEKYGLIERTGITYRRRFYKGKTLINICNHSQYCLFLYQYESCTHGQKPAGTSQKVAGTGQKPAIIEVKENKRTKRRVSHNLNPLEQEYLQDVAYFKKMGFKQMNDTFEEWLNKRKE